MRHPSIRTDVQDGVCDFVRTPSSRFPLVLGLTMLLALSASSCARCSGGSESGTGTSPPAAVGTGSNAPANGSRCSVVGSPMIFGEAVQDDPSGDRAPVPFGAELGGTASSAAGFLVGLRAAGRTGALHVSRITLDGVLSSLVTIPSTTNGRPPLVTTDPEGNPVFGTLVADSGRRAFRISRLEKNRAPQVLGEIVEGDDESEATVLLATASGPVVAWDEADAHERGIVRLRVLGGAPGPGEPSEVNGRAQPNATNTDKAGATRAGTEPVGPPDVINPARSDAAWPTLVRAPEGERAVLLWFAERPDSADLTDGAPGEPSQVDAFRWVESVVVDLRTARPVGSVRTLTSLDGHAQTLAAHWSKQGLVVVVRDDPRPTDGDGGTLVGVRAVVDASGAIGEPTRAPTFGTGIAPGTPFVFLLGDSAFVAYETLEGETKLVPTFAPGDPTTESALRGRRVIAAQGDALLASRLAGPGIDFVVARCHQ